MNKFIKIISREDAHKKGMIKYFTGKACLRGHTCERYITSKLCIECSKENARNYYKKYQHGD